MKNRKVYVTTFCGVAVAMNIVLGIITSALGIPLYLDTLGTVLSAAILGPLPGIIVGALSNIITGLIYSVSDIPFCLVNMAVGLIVGLVAKKWKFGIVPAVITGIALSFICPAIGTPIGIYVYGGLNGSVSDMLVMSLVQGGKTILGPNGSGKSTLARHLNVLLLPNEGKVWIDGKDTQAKERLYEIRSRVGMVFQNPDNQIIGTSVEEDVAFGPENKNVEPEKIRKIVEDVLRKVRLWEKRKTPPSKLSGGQKQRLATADALAGIPECLVLDEPTAMLDPSSRKEVINIVKELNQKEGMTIILITHHTDEVVDADRIILMKDGKIIGDDTPKKIFADHSLLKSAKMDIPPVVELSMRLKKQNIGLDEPVLHEQEMIRKITELYRSKCGGWKDTAR